MNNKILYLPLDDRPCVYDFTLKTAKNAGFDLIVPDKKILGSFLTQGNYFKIRDWLKQNIKKTHTALIYADSFVFTNLISSRSYLIDVKETIKRFNELKEILNTSNAVIYLYSILLRQAPTGYDDISVADAEKIVRISNEISKDISPEMLLDPEWFKNIFVKDFSDKHDISESLITRYLMTRFRNLSLNLRIMELVRDRKCYRLFIGTDDIKTKSINYAEAELIKKLIGKMSFSRRVTLYNGTDEGGQLMLAGAISRIKDLKPCFKLFYFPDWCKNTVTSYENLKVSKNIKLMVESCGGRIVKDNKSADIILLINGPLGFQYESESQDESIILYKNYYSEIYRLIAENKKLNKITALIDIAYSNGSDISLIDFLEKSTQLSFLDIYSAWNTSGNSIAGAISQSISLLINGKNRSLNIELTAERFLDDHIYQSRIRKMIRKKLLLEKISPYNLKNNRKKTENIIRKMMSSVSENFLKKNFPKLNKKIFFRLPWKRIFEIGIEIK